MGSIANRDAAEQACAASQRKLDSNDLDGAMRMAQKSLALFPTDAAHALVRLIEERRGQQEAVRKVLTAADYYELLGVERAASAVEIKAAFQRLSKLVHPDKNAAPGAQQAFQLLNDARGTLSDPAKRDQYARTHPPGRAAHAQAAHRAANPGGRGGASSSAAS